MKAMTATFDKVDVRQPEVELAADDQRVGVTVLNATVGKEKLEETVNNALPAMRP